MQRERLGRAVGPRRTRRVVANFWKNFARFRLYRRRSLQVSTRFFSIFQNLPDYLAEIFEIWQNLNFANFETFAKLLLNFHENC